MISLFIGIVCVGLDIYVQFFCPMLIDSRNPVIFKVNPSTSATLFVRNLSDKHLIHSPRLLLCLIRMASLSSQLKAGIYQITPGESAWQFLQRVAMGDVLRLPFRILDGTTLRDVIASLQKAPYLNHAAIDWSSISASYPSAEGLLLADTYLYEAQSLSQKLIHQAHQNLVQYLQKSWENRSKELPYQTSYELLIVASIIEKEASDPKEKRLISGVIVNRLAKKMPLQMDPTVIYAKTPRLQEKLTHEDLSIDSPYNTYRYRGLPPTPIAMVGKDAIDAAAHPEASNYLYFVAKGDGTHYFSANYEQQKQAILRYIKAP
ncbi:MAG: endolytic transglycosylase MltG [Legionellales bacterium]|nr:endolytic transglycosylase MltG [Legionellales bacterium]